MAVELRVEVINHNGDKYPQFVTMGRRGNVRDFPNKIRYQIC